MKRKLYIILLVSLIGMIGFGLVYYNKYKKIVAKYKVSISNEKAWRSQTDSIKNQVNIFQYTIKQYKYMNDSISRKLQQTQKNLNIKDKNLRELQYLSTNISKIDTLILNDTLFIKDFEMDTIIGDEWVNNYIYLKYPFTIQLKTNIRSEKEVLIHSHKETINPPSKWFFIRWFQKKHEVIKVDIKENNPYIESEENKFIKIIE